MKLPKAVKRQLSVWALPLIVSGGVLFGFTAITQADTPPSTSELAKYLETDQLQVSVESVDGYQQVYYLYEGNKIFLTGAKFNHTDPVADGSTVVWQGTPNGASQIFVFDVLTEALVQLTSAGTNQKPSVSGNLVIWETWVNEHWGISYYDGQFVRSLTDGTKTAVRPISDGKKIIFTEEQATDWRTFSYDVATAEFTLVRQGDEQSTAYPAIQPDGVVTTEFSKY